MTDQAVLLLRKQLKGARERDATRRDDDGDDDGARGGSG
jgi:hypothetical protein